MAAKLIYMQNRDDVLWQSLTAIARRRDVSVASVVRDAAAEWLLRQPDRPAGIDHLIHPPDRPSPPA
jgi:hypothetical protein